ncbi:MAG: hypothetical protein U9O98_09220 [Asgard group archaeon]|nr:hypothetical protein [Asgard group archaeon]
MVSKKPTDVIRLEEDKKKGSDNFFSFIKKSLRFLVRQLYRMQYGYTKLNVFVNILNTVSLLLIVFSLEDFFNIQWWHMLLIYIGMISILLLTVFIFEIFGAWHTEQRQLFKMKQSELWRDQMELRALLFAKYLSLSDEELEERLEAVERRLFPDKFE